MKIKRILQRSYDAVNDTYSIDYIKITESQIICTRYESQLFVRNNRPVFKKRPNVIYLGIGFAKRLFNNLNSLGVFNG